MKKQLIVTIAVVLAVFFANAQKIYTSIVPAAVKAGFSKQYQGITAKWEKEAGKYEANFKQNGNTMSALFEANGTMTESEMDITVA